MQDLHLTNLTSPTQMHVKAVIMSKENCMSECMKI